MKNEHKDDIKIGDDQWIKFIDLSGRYDHAIDIDEYMLDVNELWISLETYCVAGCCGLDAFDFSPEGIQKANESVNLSKLLPELVSLKNKVISIDSDVLMSKRLNNYFDKGVFTALLDHIIKNIPASPV